MKDLKPKPTRVRIALNWNQMVILIILLTTKFLIAWKAGVSMSGNLMVRNNTSGVTEYIAKLKPEGVQIMLMNNLNLLANLLFLIISYQCYKSNLSNLVNWLTVAYGTLTFIFLMDIHIQSILLVHNGLIMFFVHIVFALGFLFINLYNLGLLTVLGTANNRIVILYQKGSKRIVLKAKPAALKKITNGQLPQYFIEQKAMKEPSKTSAKQSSETNVKQLAELDF